MSGKQAYYYDLHIHTSRHSSCSRISPEEILSEAREMGLDGIALTEHFYLWTPEEIQELKIRVGCPEFPVLAGCEISTQSKGQATGDVLVFGVTEIPHRPCALDEICLTAHKQGGLVIAAHPFAQRVGMGKNIHSTMFDCIESANYRYRNLRDTIRLEDFCHDMGIPSIASSDAHDMGEIGRYCVQLDELVLTAQDLVRVIREGRCRPCLKPPPGKIRRFLFGQQRSVLAHAQ